MAAGDTYRTLGTTFKVASGKPATEDQTGYGALTWVLVEGVISLPQRGDTSEDVTQPTLADGRVEHWPGQVDGGVLEIPLKFTEADAGQTLILGNLGSNATFSFQEVDTDATADFYFGRIMAAPRTEATTNGFKGNLLQIGVNSERFTGVEET